MWNRLYLPGTIVEVRGKLKTERTALVERISSLQADRQKLDADREALKNTPPEKLDARAIAKAQGLPGRELELLRQELDLRKDLAEHLAHIRAASCEQFDAAFTTFQAEEQRILEALIGMGYVDPRQDSLNRSRVLPGWIHVHPTVVAARGRRDELHSEMNSSADAINANNAEIEAIERRLASVVQRLSSMTAA